MPKKPDDPWAVVSTAPTADSATTTNPWAVTSTAGDPASVAPPPTLGSGLEDVGSVVSQRLKNFVAAPFQAFTAPPTPEEQQTFGPGINSPLAHVSLGVKRMFVDPTTQSAGNAVQQFKAGNFDAGMQSSMDAIPVVGPWARLVSNDAQQHGAVAALAGLATDVAVPKIAGKAIGAGMRTIGKAGELATTTPANRALFATRTLVPGSAEQVLTRALKPPVTMPDFEQSAAAALP